MSARCLYIYVYNGRIEQDKDPTYWLEQIRAHGGTSPVLFLINETRRRADIAENTLKEQYPSLEPTFYRVDIGNRSKTKLEEFRQKVMDMVRNNPAWNNQIVSAEAYKIKNDLQKSFDKSKAPHIKRKDFDVIANKYDIHGDRIEEVLENLHTLGICFWYNKDDMGKFKMLVLNPDWITNGIYRLINKGHEERKPKLTVNDGVRLLKRDKRYKYPSDKVEYLFQLMRVYELAYFKDNTSVFIPGILSPDQPNDLPKFDDDNDRLTMVFSVEKFLPPNIITRVVVQRNEFGEIVNEGLLWRRGAVLKYRKGDAMALIVEDGQNVTVRVKGKDKTKYLTSLRETLKYIFDSYKILKPELKYEVLLPETYKKNKYSDTLKMPLMLLESAIRGCLRAGRAYFDATNERDVPLEATGQAYAIHCHAPVTIVDKNYGNVVITPNLPTSVSEEQFAQILKSLVGFLTSKQATEELGGKYLRELQTLIDEVRKLGHKTGWDRIHKFLTASAAISAVVSPILLKVIGG